MNTTIPAPILCETRVMDPDGEPLTLKNPTHGDVFDLKTGDAHVARMIGGVRYDTKDASLIVGFGEYLGFCSYSLFRLYRTTDGKFFVLQMLWVGDEGRVEMKVLSEAQDILSVAKALLVTNHTAEFLRGWYCSGLLPWDDEFVRNWAESVLPVAECEAVLAALAGRYAPRHSEEAAKAEEPNRTT